MESNEPIVTADFSKDEDSIYVHNVFRHRDDLYGELLSHTKIAYDYNTLDIVYTERRYGGAGSVAQEYSYNSLGDVSTESKQGRQGIVNEDYFRSRPERFEIMDCADSINYGDTFLYLCKDMDGLIMWGKYVPERMGSPYLFNWKYFFGVSSREFKITSLLLATGGSEKTQEASGAELDTDTMNEFFVSEETDGSKQSKEYVEYVAKSLGKRLK